MFRVKIHKSGKKIFIVIFFSFFLSLLFAGKTTAGESIKKPECTGPCSTEIYGLRLRPGQDLKEELDKFAKEHNLEAGYIITCCGSLTEGSIRFANKNETVILKGHFEIVSLTGTLSSTGGSHIHISVSDGEGRTYGGHLMAGSKIYTTAEIVLGNIKDVKFTRENDEDSGYKELKFSQ